MSGVGVWHVRNNVPEPLKASSIGFEKQVEDWIEQDPTLLRGGLTIVGRQLWTEAGPLDLLALDPLGRWVVIELKAEMVRRQTVAQALDYAACISDMPFDELCRKADEYLKLRKLSLRTLPGGIFRKEEDSDEREVMMIVVGRGREPGLERMTGFLADKFNVPISVVSYDVFELAQGELILARDLEEADNLPALPRGAPKQSRTVEELLRMADENGVGDMVRKIQQAAEEVGLSPRPYAGSLMYRPPSNRTRMLFTVWMKPKANGSLKAFVGPEVFAEFYPVSEEQALTALGPSGWREMNRSDVDAFVEGLMALLKERS